MKIEHVSLREDACRKNICMHFPSGYVRCENNGRCSLCDFADRLRRNRPPNVPLFTYRDALKQTKKSGGENFLGKPVLLTPECMLRLRIERNALYQMAMVYDGAGAFPMNSGSTVDVYLIADRTKRYTVGRKELYGIPTPDCARRYDELYLLGVSQML